MNETQLWHLFWFLAGCAFILLLGYVAEGWIEKIYPESCD